MTREETKEKIADEAYYLNLQNLSGREDFQEAFKLGIFAGIEEAFEFIPSWVSVEDRMPEDFEWVIGCDANDFKKPFLTRFEETGWCFNRSVTHWQPLPQKPTK